MILDTFCFFNEYDMLDFRLKYLWDYVDKFVICEADRTHSGERKTLNFFNNKDRFDWAMDKIVYHPVAIDTDGLDLSYKPNEFDFTAPQWRIENQQRAAIIDACKEFNGDDILMLSDCDEMPSRQAIEFRKANALLYPMACDQRIVAYYLNYVRNDIGWRGTVMCDLQQAREIGTQELRNKRNLYSPFPQGGWHLSFFGGAEQIKKKIQSYAHAENNTEEYTDLGKIDNAIKNGGELFPDGGKLEKVDASFYPKDFFELTPEGWML